jgi:hypothetical protein
MQKYHQSNIYLIFLLFLTQFISNTDAIGTQAAICYGGCASAVMACYSSHGYTFGVFTPNSNYQVVNTCNMGFSACMSRCSMDIRWLG